MRSIRVAILLFFALTGAQAAEIDVKRLEGGSTLVVVEGKLEISDVEAFQAKVASLPAGGTTVAFQSQGGHLLAGIRIGTVIRSKKFATVVPDAAECASACALAWLGGTRRFVGKEAMVGFHAAFTLKEDGAPAESAPGNAILGAYLNQLGLSEKAILYVTQAVPESIQWMSMREAAELGIVVSPLPPPKSARKPTATATARAEHPEGTPEQRAIDFVLNLVKRWSEPNTELLSFLNTSYAEKVLYFGKPTPRETVLVKKRKLADRWTRRAYTIRPGSVSATCAGTGETCRVKGIVSWKFENPETKGSASGVSSFEFSVINDHNALQIAAETSSAKDKPPATTNPLKQVGQRLEHLVSQISGLRTANQPAKPATANQTPKPVTRPKTPVAH